MRIGIYLIAALFIAAASLPLLAQDEPSAAETEALAKLEQLEKAVNDALSALVPFGGTSGAQDEAVTLQQRSNELGFERVVLEARREAMEKQIALLAEKVQKALAQDKLLTIMRATVAEQDKGRQEMVKRGVAPSGEMRAQSLAEQLQLAQRENEVAKQAGQDIINRLSGELVDMEIREAELAARERHLLEMRKLNRANLQTVRDIQQMQSQASQLRNQLTQNIFGQRHRSQRKQSDEPEKKPE